MWTKDTRTEQLFFPILASLLAFILAAILGLGMRLAFVIDIPEWFNYRYIQHGHSHVALLGWLFGIFGLCIIHYFGLKFRRYTRIYWALQAMVAGMLLTFPLMGYASLSIVFSTGHILISYVFAFKLWRDIGSVKALDMPKLFVRTSLIFMVLSTLGTWLLGPIMAMGMKGTAIYYASIQFYLHFQFNGWFVFAMIGIGLALLNEYKIVFDESKVRRFYWLLTISAVLTYALAVTWSTPYPGIFVVNSAGVVLQLIALIAFLFIIFEKRTAIKNLLSSYVYYVFFIALVALALKIVVQSAVVIPSMAEVSYTIRNFVIGFIHLLMLGCLSLFAFGCISNMQRKPLSRTGTWIFIVGVVSSEILLFTQGLMFWQGWGFMPYYYAFLGLASSFIMLGVVILTWRFFIVKVEVLNK